jgi:transposase
MSQYARKAIKKSTKTKETPADFSVIELNACGIDVGGKSIFVCVPGDRDPNPIREFSAFTADLRDMGEWLKKCGVTTVAMESTGVYWVPVFEVLDQYKFDVQLVNAHHVKNVPGRKTDVSDAAWIQRLHSVGLLSGSFRPADEVVVLRNYVRHRSTLTQKAADQLNYAQKALEQLNIKLGYVISDISGETGSRIIEDIIRGERDPVKLASHRDPRCKATLEVIAKALEGNWREEHLLSLRHAWESYLYAHKQILECEQAIEKLLNTFEKTDCCQRASKAKTKAKSEKRTCNKSPYYFDMKSQLHEWAGVDLCALDGINENIAAKVLSEIGTNMNKWKSGKHFASWLAVCPGNKISGGKRLSGKTKPSKNKAREALGMAAQSLSHSDSYLGAYYRKMRSKFGAQKANRAASHKLARIIYAMLKYKKEFNQLTESDFEAQNKEKTLRKMKQRAKDMGFALVPLQATG